MRQLALHFTFIHLLYYKLRRLLESNFRVFRKTQCVSKILYVHDVFLLKALTAHIMRLVFGAQRCS